MLSENHNALRKDIAQGVTSCTSLTISCLRPKAVVGRLINIIIINKNNNNNNNKMPSVRPCVRPFVTFLHKP